MDTFDFCPDRNVPVTLPREASATAMSMNGWQFTSRPVTPIVRKFKVTLYGLRWYFKPDNTFDTDKNKQFNARVLELFYEAHEMWSPFTFKHQHLGDQPCRFATPLALPVGLQNSGGFTGPVEMTLIQHNPGYS